MNVVVDRIVQYPNRFQLVNTSTGVVLGVFDLSPVTGTIQQVGTEINAELFQSIQDDLTNLAQGIVAERYARGVDVTALQDSIATKITANGGELGNAVVTFADVSNATNIASGEKASTLFGKIKNWISRLKALAFKDTIADGDISSSANISQSKVSGLTAIQSKLDGIESGANKYVLPVSTATNLGGVKVGSRLSVASDGTLSANSQTENSYTTTEKNKLAGIESGAQKNAVTSVNGKTGALTGFVTDTGMQTFNRGTSGATSKVVINETDYDALVVKNLEDENKKTAISSDYVWIQNNSNEAVRISTDGVLKFDESHPNGSTAKFPDIPDGESRTMATEENTPNALVLSTPSISVVNENGLSVEYSYSSLYHPSGDSRTFNVAGYIPVVAGSGISIAKNDSGKAEIRARVPYTFVVSNSSSNTSLAIHASFPADIIPLSTWTPSQFFSYLYSASGRGPLVGSGSYQGKYGVFDIILLSASQINIAYDKTGTYSSATISASTFTTFRIYER